MLSRSLVVMVALSAPTEQQFGRYRLRARLAIGGMAEIFLAKQDGLDGFQKDVVIKRMLPSFAVAPEYVTMFMDEAKLVARLRHENLVDVLDLGAVDGMPFIAME